MAATTRRRGKGGECQCLFSGLFCANYHRRGRTRMLCPKVINGAMELTFYDNGIRGIDG